MALESTSIVLKRLKSVVCIPGTVLARQECGICMKRKTKKGGSGYETYEQCETIKGAETLITHVYSGTDEYVSVELQDLTIADILAEEFMYHQSCYRNICRIEKQVVNPEEIQGKRVREKCFNDLKTIVQMKVIKNGELMRLGSVSDNYRKPQETTEIEPKVTLKSRLKNAFGKKADIPQRSGGLPEIIYGTENVPFKAVQVKEVMSS